MEKLNFSDPLLFTGSVLITFLIIVFRYFLAAGGFFIFFHHLYKEKYSPRKINTRDFPRKQMLREVAYSLLTSLIFALAGSFSVLLYQKGLTRVYEDPMEMGLLYLLASLPLYMLLHETYYYFLHRLMHHKKVFRIVHKVHHESNIPSPWTSFSFHPTEALLQALVLPVLIMVLPINVGVLLIYLILMTISSVINHSSVELYPQGWNKHWLGRWLIGASHHSLHHSEYRYNFGLFFTFWDKILDTESPSFHTLFNKKTKN